MNCSSKRTQYQQRINKLFIEGFREVDVLRQQYTLLNDKDTTGMTELAFEHHEAEWNGALEALLQKGIELKQLQAQYESSMHKADSAEVAEALMGFDEFAQKVVTAIHAQEADEALRE